MICYHCKKQVSIEEKTRLTSRDDCPHCRSSLRCCLNCRFYDQNRPNQCAEPQAERVVHKDRANYCLNFEPASETDSTSKESAQDKARKQFDAMFKNK